MITADSSICSTVYFCNLNIFVVGVFLAEVLPGWSKMLAMSTPKSDSHKNTTTGISCVKNP